MNIQVIKFLNQLKNASLVHKEIINVEYNTFVLAVLKILYKEGFIQSFKIKKEINNYQHLYFLSVSIRYYCNKPVFNNLKIISTSSRVKYLSYKSISRLNTKKANFFFSTNEGLLTGFECKQQKVGGVLLFIC